MSYGKLATSLILLRIWSKSVGSESRVLKIRCVELLIGLHGDDQYEMCFWN